MSTGRRSAGRERNYCSRSGGVIGCPHFGCRFNRFLDKALTPNPCWGGTLFINNSHASLHCRLEHGASASDTFDTVFPKYPYGVKPDEIFLKAPVRDLLIASNGRGTAAEAAKDKLRRLDICRVCFDESKLFDHNRKLRLIVHMDQELEHVQQRMFGEGGVGRGGGSCGLHKTIISVFDALEELLALGVRTEDIADNLFIWDKPLVPKQLPAAAAAAAALPPQQAGKRVRASEEQQHEGEDDAEGEGELLPQGGAGGMGATSAAAANPAVTAAANTLLAPPAVPSFGGGFNLAPMLPSSSRDPAQPAMYGGFISNEFGGRDGLCPTGSPRQACFHSADQGGSTSGFQIDGSCPMEIETPMPLVADRRVCSLLLLSSSVGGDDMNRLGDVRGAGSGGVGGPSLGSGMPLLLPAGGNRSQGDDGHRSYRQAAGGASTTPQLQFSIGGALSHPPQHYEFGITSAPKSGLQGGPSSETPGDAAAAASCNPANNSGRAGGGILSDPQQKQQHDRIKALLHRAQQEEWKVPPDLIKYSRRLCNAAFMYDGLYDEDINEFCDSIKNVLSSTEPDSQREAYESSRQRAAANASAQSLEQTATAQEKTRRDVVKPLLQTALDVVSVLTGIDDELAEEAAARRELARLMRQKAAFDAFSRVKDVYNMSLLSLDLISAVRATLGEATSDSVSKLEAHLQSHHQSLPKPVADPGALNIVSDGSKHLEDGSVRATCVHQLKMFASVAATVGLDTDLTSSFESVRQGRREVGPV